MPQGYAAILADPPWLERGGGQCKRGADRHYPLLATIDIPRVIMASGFWSPANDAHLYLWATNNFLPDGLWVMSQLGFRYVTNVCWVKDRAGLGQYFRGKHELLLFGVRGRGFGAKTDARDIDSVLDDESCYGAPRGEHSAKPHLFHELVERRSRGPYLELFARSQRDGWTSWGTDIRARMAEPGPSCVVPRVEAQETTR